MKFQKIKPKLANGPLTCPAVSVTSPIAATEIAFGSGMLKVIESIDQHQVHELWMDDLESTEFVIKYDDLYGE